MAQEMSIKRVLLSDVAKLAGLSKATLSRYMNNNIVLPQETIDRIETAIRELDYRGNSLARRLSKGGSETLGLVLPDITNPFFAELADAAEEAASASAVHHPQQPGKRVPVHSLAGYLPGRRPAVHHQPPR
jgi:LacI family transcriptional regulator